MKLLIVDDEKDVLDLFRDIFLKQAYEVHTANSGKEALEVFEKIKPDVIMLDIKMPDADGLEVLDDIKKKDPSVAVVMLTAYGYNDDLINKSMERGASGFISKNLPLKQIVNTFNTLLKTINLKNEA